MPNDVNREALGIEVDSSLPSVRLVRAFKQLKVERGFPDIIRADHTLESLGQCFTQWYSGNGMIIEYIDLGKSDQNSYIERFNWSYRTEALDTWLFKDLDEAREMT